MTLNRAGWSGPLHVPLRRRLQKDTHRDKLMHTRENFCNRVSKIFFYRSHFSVLKQSKCIFWGSFYLDQHADCSRGHVGDVVPEGELARSTRLFPHRTSHVCFVPFKSHRRRFEVNKMTCRGKKIATMRCNLVKNDNTKTEAFFICG